MGERCYESWLAGRLLATHPPALPVPSTRCAAAWK